MNLVTPPLSGSPQAVPLAPRSRVAAEETPVLRQYLRIAMRWRYVILGAIVASLLIGLVVTFLMTPQYMASATIEISRESGQVTNFEGVERQETSADQEFYQTQYGLLRSRALSERVATQLRLVDDPKFFDLLDAGDDTPAFQITNGRYPASGRGRAPPGRRRGVADAPRCRTHPAVAAGRHPLHQSRIRLLRAGRQRLGRQFHPDQPGTQGPGDLVRPATCSSVSLPSKRSGSTIPSASSSPTPRSSGSSTSPRRARARTPRPNARSWPTTLPR